MPAGPVKQSGLAQPRSTKQASGAARLTTTATRPPPASSCSQKAAWLARPPLMRCTQYDTKRRPLLGAAIGRSRGARGARAPPAPAPAAASAAASVASPACSGVPPQLSRAPSSSSIKLSVRWLLAEAQEA